MFDFFLASLMGAVLIVIVMLVRKAVREKFKGGMLMFLWGVVLMRLLIPFNPLGAGAPVTLRVPERSAIEIPAKQPASAAPSVEQTNKMHVPVEVGSPAGQQGHYQQGAAVAEPALPRTSGGWSQNMAVLMKQHTLEQLLFCVWIAGTLIAVLYLVVARIVFARTMRKDCVRLEDDAILPPAPADVPVYVTHKQIGPLVVGLFRPYLIVPQCLVAKERAERSEKERLNVHFALQHEMMHIRRKDLWVKSLYLIARSIHWFNPLVWFMGNLLNQDIEYACDEAVTSELDEQEKVIYCQTLLDLASTVSAQPDNFSSSFTGDGDMLKKRIRNIIQNPLLKCGRIIAAGLAFVMGVSLFVVSCSSKAPDITSADLTGRWYGQNAFEGDRKIEFFFSEGGEFKIDRQVESLFPYMLYGTYKCEGDNVILTSNGDDGSLVFTLDGDTLVLTEQDLISTLFPDHYTLERDRHASRTELSPEEKVEFSHPVYFRDPEALLAEPDLLAEPHHFDYPEPARKIGSILYFAGYKGFFGFDLEKNTMAYAVQITDHNFPSSTQGEYIRTLNISKDEKKLLLVPSLPPYAGEGFSGVAAEGFIRPYWYEYDLETKALERKLGDYDALKANVKELGEEEKDLRKQYKWEYGTTTASYQDVVLTGPDGKEYKPFAKP